LKIYVGTSGYSYFWNEGKKDPLGWYVSKGFKTVEINSTFYSFPSYASIKRWSKVGEDFIFSVKVNRMITHYTKLANIDLFKKFYSKFEPLWGKVKFWLFQLSPSFLCTDKNVEKLESFVKQLSIKGVPVLEFRDPCWWKVKNYIIKLGYIFCSVSAPGFPDDIVNSQGMIYMRFHGIDEWYSYVYSEKELKNYYDKIINSRAEEAYLYFNNDLGMLENALFMQKLSEKA
jgi:uncharacterized protein YecE (DUF72 family)